MFSAAVRAHILHGRQCDNDRDVAQSVEKEEHRRAERTQERSGDGGSEERRAVVGRRAERERVEKIARRNEVWDQCLPRRIIKS